MMNHPIEIQVPPFIKMSPEVRHYFNQCLLDYLNAHSLIQRAQTATRFYFKLNDTCYTADKDGSGPIECLIKCDSIHSHHWYFAYISQWVYLKPYHKTVSRFLDFDFESSKCFLPNAQHWQPMRSNFVFLSLYAQWERGFLSEVKAGNYDDIRIHVF